MLFFSLVILIINNKKNVIFKYFTFRIQNFIISHKGTKNKSEKEANINLMVGTKHARSLLYNMPARESPDSVNDDAPVKRAINKTSLSPILHKNTSHPQSACL